MPPIDLDACELDALGLFLDVNNAHLRVLADGCPRLVAPKARRTHARLTQALLEQWAWPESRAFLAERMAATNVHVALGRRGLEVLPELAAIFPPNALLWWAHDAADLDPEEVLAALSEEDRQRFAERQPLLQNLAHHLREVREARYAAADDARSRAARVEADRLTRGLRWRADQAEAKLRRASAQVEAVAQDKEAVIRGLERELETARRQAADSEARAAELRQALEAALEAHRQTTADLAAQVRQLASAVARGIGAPVPPLIGERVLVIGDDSHKAQYQGMVLELGGHFAFHPGFALGPRLDAALASATLVVYIAAYAAHGAQDHVRRAERAGLPVVTVPVAGGESFRRAVLAWCVAREASSGNAPAAARSPAAGLRAP